MYKDKEKERLAKKKWKENNKEKVTEYMKEYHREWYQKNKKNRLLQINKWRSLNKDKTFRYRNSESTKRYSLFSRHGVTLEWFNEEVNIQYNKCAICSNHFKNEKDKCVDHCHVSGKIRQILCFNCNIGIGKFKDSVELLEKALNYLKRHNGL